MSNFRNRRLVSDAEAAKKYQLKMRLLRSIVSVIGVVLFSGYVSVSLYKKFGSLTISVNKFNDSKYSLILSETPDFANATATLAAKETPDITNISEADLPDDLNDINGQHNGPNYFAYTFYLMNNGDNTLTYEYKILLTDITQDVDKAIRIRLYVDGEYTTYARVRSDGSGLPETGTTPFLSAQTVMTDNKKDFQPEDITKFTVVIWIEGNDKDCKDEIIGGQIKCDMQFNVTEDSLNFAS